MGPITSRRAVRAGLVLATTATAALASTATAAPGDVVARAEANYPYAGIALTAEKRIGSRGEIVGRALDSSGRPVSEDEVARRDLQARRERLGALTPQLAERVASASPDERIGVAIWLAEDERPALSRPAVGRGGSVEEADAVLAAVDRTRAAEVADLVGPFVERLGGAGVELRRSGSTPLLTGSVPAGILLELATDERIDTIYLDEEKPGAETNVSREIVGATTAPAAGLDGSGVRVGVVEFGGLADTTNPWLTIERSDASATCNAAALHATGVAGVIAAQPGLRVIFEGIFPRFLFSGLEGFAPRARMFVGSFCANGESQTRADAAADWGARVINNSYFTGTSGSVEATDRHLDGLVHNRWRTLVKSAGNRGTGDGRVTSPGLGYNVLAVANVNTFGTASRSDDVMAATSSFVDPTSTHSDREKPEIAAPGSGIRMLSAGSPWGGQTDSGTSFAAPMVTGVAARLIQRKPFLAVWPEQIRPILMASAIHNVEGAARLSERDGAGMMAANRAVGILDANAHGGERVDCSTFPASKTLATVSLRRGQRLRAAISWTTDPGDPQHANQPSSDLDLSVVAQTGGQSAHSASFDNTSEIVDLRAAASGVFTVRVTRFRCARSTFVGWAHMVV